MYFIEQWSIALCSFGDKFANVNKRTMVIEDPSGFRNLNFSEIMSNYIKLLPIIQSRRITPN